MDKPKKIQTDSMYGEFGGKKQIIPREHGEKLLEAIIKEGCIKQSLDEVKNK